MTERAGNTRETLKEGWRNFVDLPTPEPPALLSIDEMRALSSKELNAYNRRRLAYASAMPPISQLYRKAQDTIERTIERNEFKPPGARPGVVLDGQSANGKTTMLMEIGRKYEREQRELREEHKSKKRGEFLPVVYINVDSVPTLKSLNRSILEFYGFDPKRASTNRMTTLVFECIERCETSLILIDEVHMLALHRISDRDVNNHLKILANSAKATFVYAGVELANNDFMIEGLLPHEVSRAQISRRFKLIKVEPIGQNGTKQQALMSGVLEVYENQLKLVNSQPGDLTNLALYIWRRTQGVIGSIAELVYLSFREAIVTGSERITKELMAGVEIDDAAEARFEKWRRIEHGDLDLDEAA